jgi:MarR family transcriptional regulator, transcriptional regulator for hemolysin
LNAYKRTYIKLAYYKLDELALGRSALKLDLENDLLILIYDLARQMRTRVDREAAKFGMTRAQWVILARLERQPGLSQNELAAVAEVAPITIGRLVDRLEEQGLVKRCPDPKDRRIWRLSLTPKADPFLKLVQQYRADLRALMTRNIDKNALDAMAKNLRTMKENLNSALNGGETGENIDDCA